MVESSGSARSDFIAQASADHENPTECASTRTAQPVCAIGYQMGNNFKLNTSRACKRFGRFRHRLDQLFREPRRLCRPLCDWNDQQTNREHYAGLAFVGLSLLLCAILVLLLPKETGRARKT